MEGGKQYVSQGGKQYIHILSHKKHIIVAEFSIKLFSLVYFSVSVVRQRNKYKNSD